MTVPTRRCPNPNPLPVAEHVFETTASETLHTGKIFALRRDEVRMPGGKIVTREVVEHYGAVAVVAIDDRLVVIHHFRMGGLKRAERHHVEITLEALEFGGFCIRSVGPAMGRIMRGDLARFKIKEIKSFVRRRL